MTEAPVPAIGLENELNLLQMEYERICSEIRMYVQQYSPKFNIFGILVISAITFAWQNPRYGMVYPILPFFIFVIGGIAIAQTYLITCLAERVRQIEVRIAELNNGKPVVCWEHIMAPQLVYPPWLNVKTKQGGVFRGPNPIFGSVILMFIAGMPVIIFCMIKSWSVLPAPWNLLYFVLTAVVCALMLWYSTSFFRMGNITSSLDYYTDGSLDA